MLLALQATFCIRFNHVNYRSLGGMPYLPHILMLVSCGPFSHLFDLGFASTSRSSVSDLFRGFIFAFQDLV